MIANQFHGMLCLRPMTYPGPGLLKTHGLDLPSGHNYGYRGLSRPAPSGICPAPYYTLLEHYAG